MRGVSAAGPIVVGREAELARVEGFVSGRGPSRGLVVVGEPGIGKTTLWEAGLDASRKAGQRVLVARASEPEVRLGFVALTDLLDEIHPSAVEGLPAPQRRALEVAVLRAEPDESPPDQFGVAAGFTRLVRLLAEQAPVVVAVDDVPWLDRESEDTLAYAARRLREHPVRFLLTRRPGEPTMLEKAFGSGGVERLEVGGLSLGAVRSLLAERLELTPPRRVLLRLFELSHGSPLVALELGRTLVERGLPDLGEELPLPELVDEVFGRRIAGLSEGVRQAVLAVALSGGLARLEVSSLVGPLSVEDAIAAGLLVSDGKRVRVSHPLLAAAARRFSTAEERRKVHVQLSSAIADETLQARHLAIATSRPDDALVQRLLSAAERAVSRGGIHDAVELAEHALRLTTVGSAAYEERLLALVRYLQIAGEQERVRELLLSRLDDLGPGSARARALLMLSETGEQLSEMETYLDAALREGGADAEVRSTALATKALMYAIVRFERLDDAEEWAREAVSLAHDASDGVQQRALHALAWINVMRGRPFEPLDLAFSAAPRAASLYESAIERPAGIRLMIRGNIDESRAVFERLRALAGERGEAVSASIMHRQLCEIELRAGDVRAAQHHLDEWGEWTIPGDTHEQVVGPARCRALLAAVRGRPDEAAEWAAAAIAAAEAIENYRESTEAQRAAGLAALFSHQYAVAVEHLSTLWRHAEREGLDDPGVIPVACDLVEALIGSGEIEEAALVTQRLRRLAEEQQHPWGKAGADRCEALIRVAAEAETDYETVEVDLAGAAAEYARLGLRFDSARSLLILGRIQRRRRKWARARAAFEQAAHEFDQLGADGWATQARSELARVGGRRPTDAGTLTHAEEQVAQLAAAGHSNKEIAATLVVSVYTVERHLKHVYTKLGIRSRTQLASVIDAANGS